MKTIILDCYTDEPSGYGVRPYLGSHQIHLSQALAHQGIEHYYITIDDLRFASSNSKNEINNETNISILNKTVNANESINYINDAEVIYIIMGCFVDYNYFSCVPPKSNEVFDFLKNTKAKKILFYVMGIKDLISSDYSASKLMSIIDKVEYGNTYRFVFNQSCKNETLLDPDYLLLDKISSTSIPIINQLISPIIAEIETGTGCNTPFCKFCIESLRSPKVIYREPSSIIMQIKTLYEQGVRHFRLGRQPNFYHYQKQSVEKMEELLYGIRTSCPEIKMLHIDNVNMINVLSKAGQEITKLIVQYCTSGNIAPFGIESFDMYVRKLNGIIGSPEQVIKAIEIINKYGQEKGDNGYPKFLPGINLIHNLNGHTKKTHEINMKFLNLIIENGLQTQRLYYRYMTRPTGVSFNEKRTGEKNYDECFNDIKKNYVMPMQEKVYLSKNSNFLSGVFEVIHTKGNSLIRTFGTCPIRIEIENKTLSNYNEHKVKIISNTDYRLLKGLIID